jgi:hypothetical protein
MKELVARGRLDEAEREVDALAALEVTKVTLTLYRGELEEARRRQADEELVRRFRAQFDDRLAARDWAGARQIVEELEQALPDSMLTAQLFAEVGARLEDDRRERGIAGTLAALVATGEPVLVVCADARARRKALEGRLGGFAIASYASLTPELRDAYAHVVALDPPAEARHEALLHGRMTHLAWGAPELAFAARVHERDLDLRTSLRALYVQLRERGEDALADSHPLVAGRCLRVLGELGLTEGARVLPDPPRTELERSPSFVAFQRRLEERSRWLTPSSETARAA